MGEYDERLLLCAIDVLRDERHRVNDERVSRAGRGRVGGTMRGRAGVADFVDFGDVAQLRVPFLGFEGFDQSVGPLVASGGGGACGGIARGRRGRGGGRGRAASLGPCQTRAEKSDHTEP